MAEKDVQVPQPRPKTDINAAHVRPASFLAAVQAYIKKQKEKGNEPKMVEVVVPVSFRLTMDDHSSVQVPVGYQSMPFEWADHWFARSKGVSVAKDPEPEAKAPEPPVKAPIAKR